MQPISQTADLARRPLCLNQEQLLLSREWLERTEAMAPALASAMLSFRGPLSEVSMEQALNEIVRRHAALRVCIYPPPGVPAAERDARLRAFVRGIYTPGLLEQSVHEHVEIPMRRVDLSAVPLTFAKEELRNLYYEEATSRFDYARPPLARACLVRLGAEEHVLIVVVDQAVTDAWSMRILRTELLSLYERYSAGLSSEAPDPPMQYPDYALWQQNARNSSYFDAATSYWKGQWAGYGAARIGLGRLPFAESVKANFGASLGTEQAILEPETCHQIRTFARQHRATINVFFLAAYAIVLQSYTRESRLGIWSHFSNRGRAEIHNTFGYFVHTHLLGVDFSSSPTGTELVEQVRQTVRDAYEHQEMPLPHLWNQLNCWPRYADARVLVDCSESQETWESREMARGLVVRRVKPPELRQGRFSSLGLYVKDSGERLVLSVQYVRGRFPQAAIGTLVQDLLTVVSRLATEPGCKVVTMLKSRYVGASPPVRNQMGEFVRLPTELAQAWGLTLPSGITAGSQPV